METGDKARVTVKPLDVVTAGSAGNIIAALNCHREHKV
jgi:hypothetical protein